MLLAAVNFDDPLFWAIFIGWILSVVLHEFAHGIVAHFGGDWTIRERGGLTLNPLQYIDPFGSLALPAMIFLLGGVPLPGGATYIRRDLIRSRAWQVAVSAAGPAMNFLLFLLLVLPFHPKIGFLDVPRATTANLSAAMLFVGALAWVQMLSVLFNLVPIPPLDGFGIISQFMDEQTREKFETPPASTVLFLVFFALLWRVPALGQLFHNGVENALQMLGFGLNEIDFFSQSFNEALFGSR